MREPCYMNGHVRVRRRDVTIGIDIIIKRLALNRDQMLCFPLLSFSFSSPLHYHCVSPPLSHHPSNTATHLPRSSYLFTR